MRQQTVIDSARLPYCHKLRLAGAHCRLTTNSLDLGETLQTWAAREVSEYSCSFSMQVLVTEQAGKNLLNPAFRGLHHLVVASFGGPNVFVFDLIRRNVFATVSSELATDRRFWDHLLLPIAMGVLGTSLGVVPVHCACLSIGGAGLLIAGVSGAGKSTLAVALSQNGFDYVSDDWTYLSLDNGRLVAHGMSVPAKLLPDAVAHFPVLAQHPLRMSLNQELSYEVQVERLGANVHFSCSPECFLFLERTQEEGSRFFAVSSGEVQEYFDRSLEPLPSQLPELMQARSSLIGRISRLPCWKLRYGGPPQTAVEALRAMMERQPELSA
jgi:hypothetical protein